MIAASVVLLVRLERDLGWRAVNSRDRYWLRGHGASTFGNWTRVYAAPSENL